MVPQVRSKTKFRITIYFPENMQQRYDISIRT